MEKYTKTPKDISSIVGLSTRRIQEIFSESKEFAIFLGIKIYFRRTRGDSGTYQISDSSYQILTESQMKR